MYIHILTYRIITWFSCITYSIYILLLLYSIPFRSWYTEKTDFCVCKRTIWSMHETNRHTVYARAYMTWSHIIGVSQYYELITDTAIAPLHGVHADDDVAYITHNIYYKNFRTQNVRINTRVPRSQVLPSAADDTQHFSFFGFSIERFTNEPIQAHCV